MSVGLYHGKWSFIAVYVDDTVVVLTLVLDSSLEVPESGKNNLFRSIYPNRLIRLKFIQQ